jgi:hypothetical protein
MSAGYGGNGQALQYETTAAFDLATSEPLDLQLLSYNSSGIGFNNLQLQVVTTGVTRTYTFPSLTGSNGAETFFTANSINLGTIDAKTQVSLIFELTYNAGTTANPIDGFGFTYQFVDPPAPAVRSLTSDPVNGVVPEPSTWAMMLVGSVGLGFAAYRTRKAQRPRIAVSSRRTA